MASSMAQVEPLPLVPATVITGQSKRRPSRVATCCVRANPMSMATGCSRSQWASQSSSVCMGRLSRRHNHPMVTLYGIPNCDTVKKARAWLTEHGIAHTFHDFKKHPMYSALI
eukprot:Opistho-1_new@84539